jgi:quinol monooxygenase YgiN
VYVGEKELTTLTYYFGLPFEDVNDPESTTLMFAFEQYTDKKALTETHFNSAAMQKFLKIVPQYMNT